MHIINSSILAILGAKIVEKLKQMYLLERANVYKI